MGTLSNLLPSTCLLYYVWTCVFNCVVARPSDIYNSGKLVNIVFNK